MSKTHTRVLGAVPAGLAAPEQRVDGRDKVSGATRYAADHSMPGMLTARFLGSPYPHARLVRIDVAAARAVPGVHAVLTGADIGLVRMGRRLLDWPVLAVDRVRFMGERVAAVAADTPEAADEALRLIEVEYEELPAILDPEAALAAGAPELHPDRAEYAFIGGERPAVPHPNIQGRRLVRKGEEDIEAVFAGAARVFEQVFTTPAQHAGYLEPHASLVWIDEDDTVHVITGNKAPFSLRSQMAQSLGLPPSKIDIDAVSIGGDFGGKGLSVDEYVAYFLARATGRPIRSVMSGIDDLLTMNPRHAATLRLRTAVDAEGNFLAHDARILLDGGAYAAAKPLPHLALAGATNTLSAYRVPNVQIEVATVYTNHAPAGHVRAPGEVQALFAGESQVDTIARELGRDPLEFRLANAVRQGDKGLAGEHFREARAVEVLETLREESGWDRWTPRPGVGRGLALCVRHVGGGKTSMKLRLTSDGRLEALTGVPDQGAGAATVIQRVLAASLGVDPGAVRVSRGSTGQALPDPGAGASRVTHITSRAAEDPATKLTEALAERLSAQLGAAVHFSDGHFSVDSGQTIAFADAARMVAPDGLEVEGTHDAAAHGDHEPGDFNFCGYCIEVEVDRETGAVRILDALLVADVGTIINPVAHRGQLIGGFAFGVGAALLEELVREDGQVISASLGDMKLPTSMDVPPLRIVHLPTSEGPGAFGAKMAGELSNTAVAPAIANAVADAVGVRVTSLPIRAEAVWSALTADGPRAGGPARDTQR